MKNNNRSPLHTHTHTHSDTQTHESTHHVSDIQLQDLTSPTNTVAHTFFYAQRHSPIHSNVPSQKELFIICGPQKEINAK